VGLPLLVVIQNTNYTLAYLALEFLFLVIQNTNIGLASTCACVLHPWFLIGNRVFILIQIRTQLVMVMIATVYYYNFKKKGKRCALSSGSPLSSPVVLIFYSYFNNTTNTNPHRHNKESLLPVLAKPKQRLVVSKGKTCLQLPPFVLRVTLAPLAF
jgi:hypothetical protein